MSTFTGFFLLRFYFNARPLPDAACTRPNLSLSLNSKSDFSRHGTSNGGLHSKLSSSLQSLTSVEHLVYFHMFVYSHKTLSCSGQSSCIPTKHTHIPAKSFRTPIQSTCITTKRPYIPQKCSYFYKTLSHSHKMSSCSSKSCHISTKLSPSLQNALAFLKKQNLSH